MRRHLIRHLHHLALLSLAALLIGQLGSLHWIAELPSHFLPYYTLAFLLAALTQKNRTRILWLTCTALSAAWLIHPLDHPTPGNTHSRSLIWYNTHLDNPQAAAESAYLIAENTDLIALAEINLADPGWHPLRTHYPHGCEHREHSPFALALWSQTPLATCTVHAIAGYPYIRAQLTDHTAIYALHPPPPITRELAAARNTYLHHTATRIAQENHAIIAGDLNLSPYSPYYRRLLKESGAQAYSANWTPTWKPFLLNIDHILARGHSPHIRALPWQHSDHRPLRADY